MIRDCKHLIKSQHPYGTHDFKVCENEMTMVRSLIFEKNTNCPFYDEIILQKLSFGRNSLKKILMLNKYK